MSYCHECGEQVAKEDVFCPFCGISLKPIAAVNDSSMSDTIVNMPSPVINQQALDALTEKNKQETPVIETPIEPENKIPESTEAEETAHESGNPKTVSAGNTSENWNMKTDSVEIPADLLVERQDIPLPLPQVFGDAEPNSTSETPVSEAVEPEDIQPPKTEDSKISEPKAEPEAQNELPDVPVPAIIQNQEFDYKSEPQTVESKPEIDQNEDVISPEKNENNVDSVNVSEFKSPDSVIQKESVESGFEIFEPKGHEPLAEAQPFVEPEIAGRENEPPAVETFAPPVLPEKEETVENTEAVQPESLPNLEDEGLISEVSAPVTDETDDKLSEVSSPSFEEQEIVSNEEQEIVSNQPSEVPAEVHKFDSPDVLAEANLTDETKSEQIGFPPVEETFTEPEKIEVFESQTEPEAKESPIAMPDLPLALETPEEPTKFDSVQIFQKDEIPEGKVEELPVEPEPVFSQTGDEEKVEKPQESPKEGRSFTTPNIGNADTDGRKAAKLKPLDEGVILNGRYEIVRKIGGGGMGAVYLANDRNLGGVLRAVKEMVQSYIESDQQDKAISDFKRESMLLTSLDHPAIPTIYDYFFDEKEARFYLVMKYISGGDLSGRLRAAPEGRIDEKSVTEWAIQIADVLEYLHNHEPSIVYRDLKPANVMIDGNSGRVMLIDFGIARWVNKEEKGVTAVGTMGYAPPELFSGNVEPRSDIYSLGSTMFHLLTGADPQSNPLLIFDFQKNPRPRQINSQLSDQIERILMRAVEYNADLRFASAAQLRDELKEHLSNLKMGKVTYGIKAAPTSPAFSEQSVFCGFCGKQIVATDVFCAFCGAQQPIAQQSFSQPAIAAAQPLTAKLVILGTGELEPSSYRLEKTENLLGRRDPMSNIFPEVDLSKYDPQTKISRRHARIWRDGNNFLVEDLGSSNGTTLLPAVSDSIRLLPHQPHALTSGDKIRLGDTTLHFTVG
jgi:serine/threonine protein kinase